jgi:hypothetical protein
LPYVIPRDLINAFHQEKVNLFIGAGTSIAAGLIGWDELINEIKDVTRKENQKYSPEELEVFFNSADYFDIAEYFKETVGVYGYFGFLREKYRKNVKLSRLHHALGKLPIKTIFTTNYDKLLEDTYRKYTGQEPSVIIFPQQLGYIDDSEVRIIKLHGDIDHPLSLVLTRSDYAAYATKHREFVQVLHGGINSHTMLFVGFGLQDKNFRRIFEDARTLYDSTNREAYAIMVGVNPIQCEIWKKMGLKIINVNSYGQVTTFISKLKSSL